jgi:hypothetical protein
MREGRLEEIRECAEDWDYGKYYDTSDFADALSLARSDARELIEEVERLRGRLEAVERLVLDACAYGDDISALRVLEAARGQ